MESARKKINWSPLWLTEDWWTTWLAGFIMILAGFGLIRSVPKLPKWSGSITEAIPIDLLPGLILLGLSLGVLTALAIGVMKGDFKKYLIAFPFVFVIAVLAYAIGNQTTLAKYGFNDVVVALILGMLFSNTVGKPAWLKPALRTELFIKTGLVLMGAEILFNRVLTLGKYGLGVAWLVTPVVLFFMYQLGTRILKIKSKSMVATMAACTSVCGVSAAIAVGSATRAKKEEIGLAISVSLIFTILMMVGMPVLINALGLSQAVGGAWIGGTVDSTGAVVVAGQMVGKEAMEVAAVIKMIQNALIGIVAFFMAVLWVTRIERNPNDPRPRVSEIWTRFPKFILGFVLASVVFSFLLLPALGDGGVDKILSATKALRGWLFTLAFVSIGLDSRFSEMAKACQGSGPIKLYIVGQTFNILLTLFAAWLFFRGF